MTPSKLGILPSSVLATVLATAVGVAPINSALAAPPEDEGEEISVGDPEDEGEEISVGDPEDEGEEISVGDPEDEGEEISVGDPEDEGEEIAVGDPEDEGEEIAVGDPEGEETELPEAEETEGEEVTIDEPPDLADAGPMRPPEPTWGPKNQYPRNGKGMLITGGIVTGLGAAFIVTSVLITRCDFESALSCKFGDQRDLLIPTAVAATGLGLLLIGVGVGNHVKYKRWKTWTPEQTAVVPTYVPGGGGGVAWVGRF
jgi:hypothetical protein